MYYSQFHYIDPTKRNIAFQLLFTHISRNINEYMKISIRKKETTFVAKLYCEHVVQCYKVQVKVDKIINSQFQFSVYEFIKFAYDYIFLYIIADLLNLMFIPFCVIFFIIFIWRQIIVFTRQVRG